MKNDSSNTATAHATTLPENVRIPLNSLQADLEYLIGRVIADGSCGPTMVKSMLDRLNQIEGAIPTRQTFETIIQSLNYDGQDTDSLTVGEIRRALGPVGPAGDRGQVGWMGGEFDR
jgi:hypothetical protein